MFNKISSLYILRKIFDLLDTRVKLTHIKYTKSLQKKLLNELDYFKKISGRYLIQDNTFNYGKEFTLDKNILVYIGGYKDGKRHGKGVEYNENGTYKFEGEFLKGRKNGQGKEYRKSEHNGLIELYFEGNFKNGKKNGKGKIYRSDPNKIKFEGEYLNDLKEGLGKEYYNDGKIQFEGEYKKDKKWNGKGYDINGKIDYIITEGNGYIKLYKDYVDKLSFEGEYKNGEKNGKGKEYDHFGRLEFEGEYLNDKKHGQGKEYFRNKKILFEGEYKDGKKWNGKGYDFNGNIAYEINNGRGFVKLYTEDYCYFEGEYNNGEANGYGKSFWKGKCTPTYKEFEGIYKDDKEYEGKKYRWNNLIYEGTFKNDKYWNGKKKYYKDRFIDECYEGEYLNGEKWKGIEKVYLERESKLLMELEYLEGKIKNVKGYNPENQEIDYNINNGNGLLKYYRNKIVKNKAKYYVYFEMQLIDGEIRGIGKEYNENEKLIFEGEFYNDAKNGKGKIFNEKGKLIFEGEFYNGVKNGYGKDYFLNGKVMFEGIYINNEKFYGSFYDNKGKVKKVIKDGEGNKEIYHNNGKKIFQ